MSTVRKKYGRATALLAAGSALAACGVGGGSPHRAGAAELTGTWSKGGTSVRIAADRSYTGTGIAQVLNAVSCATGLDRGDWTLGDGRAATEGDLIAFQGGGPEHDVLCSFLGQVRQDGEGLGICLVPDLDESCSDRRVLRRTGE